MAFFKTLVMDRLKDQYGDNLITRKQIIQTILDLKQPGLVYDWREHRGEYTSVLKTDLYDNPVGCFLKAGYEKKHLDRVSKGIYKLAL
tara:strand:+ start:2147 stop:2410 length:264 start_codon:yes stop_codon:yes gene_type:complete